MNLQRVVGTVLLAAALASCAVSDAQAFGLRRAYWSAGPPVYYSAPGAFYAGPYNYNPYVMPAPAYGVLPPPFATYQMLYGTGVQRAPDRKVADRPVTARRDDDRSAHFFITVPDVNATVTFDGVKMTQKGLQREYKTPPLEREKQFVSTITVAWLESGETRTRTKEFVIIAGQLVAYTFE